MIPEIRLVETRDKDLATSTSPLHLLDTQLNFIRGAPSIAETGRGHFVTSVVSESSHSFDFDVGDLLDMVDCEDWYCS